MFAPSSRPVTRALVIPALLGVVVTAAACAPRPPTPSSDDGSTDGSVNPETPCEPVLDTTAAVQPTYRCRDGRMCSDVRPEQGDGGVYQVCPGTNGCATLVMSNGRSEIGYC
jgi:hypothetical protein